MIRRTVREPVTYSGRGLHTGRPVTVTIHPSDTGIAFRYDDTRVPASPSSVTDTRWRTTLGAVGTVEHLMSAFAGLGITDAEVELSYPELPALDGSAAHYLTLPPQPLGEAEISLPRREIKVEASGGAITVRPGSGTWAYTFRHATKIQTVTCQLPQDYPAEVAPARTFAPVDQVPALRAQGLGQGLEETSVLLLGPHGPTTTPRFPDEPARHKLLDLIGDLYLTGIPINLLDVTARFTGHTTNVRMAELLASARGRRR
ncbi:UDP-3-O-acyl-N-acetylglucosamine deacetylase [Kibdelosporangium lantanae]|uniref:UDP-3-O-acyl-N-acetylglucosamine deacetylase n=1 Tax=Kibdelosporangium lantanae TaxID=1497396 RepID=A0ABW3M901_9PSEU